MSRITLPTSPTSVMLDHIIWEEREGGYEGDER